MDSVHKGFKSVNGYIRGVAKIILFSLIASVCFVLSGCAEIPQALLSPKSRTVTSTICKDYAKNAIVAEETWGNKVVTVSGVFNNIILPTAANKNYRLNMTEYQITDVYYHAFVDFAPTKANEQELKKFRKGDRITVQGNFKKHDCYAQVLLYEGKDIFLDNGKIIK
ncbi:MAG: hypothetical protein LBP40_04170 [Campylobacteraceae bacterium]|nr:hypothetical protein [Campylobacteraceae bacterium]